MKLEIKWKKKVGNKKQNSVKTETHATEELLGQQKYQRRNRESPEDKWQ